MTNEEPETRNSSTPFNDLQRIVKALEFHAAEAYDRCMIRKGWFPRCFALTVAGVALWACMTWPLAPHAASAMAHTPRRAPNTPAVSEIVPCDNIQLLYHFWLCRDMIAGGTPAFSNIYEFNTGDDRAMRRFSPYYVPFSLVYAAVSPMFGNAAGWNAAGLFSVLLGVFGAFFLARRLCGSDGAAFVAAIVANAFPYRWITLIIGSPTGFAICLVPWILHGLDRAVRDGRAAGGAEAGMALLFAFCSDLHVFYFSSLLCPFWVLLVFLAAPPPHGGASFRKRAIRAVRALAPFAALALIAIAASHFASRDLQDSTMSGGRTLREIKLFSPIMSGLLRWENLGASNHIFFGTGLAILFFFCFVSYAVASAKSRPGWRSVALLAAATLMLAAVVLLAFGTYGPFDGLPIRIARKLVPKYTMIRQPMKIFCLMPAILVVLLALLSNALKARTAKVAAIILAIDAIAEQAAWLRPALCELPDALPAYASAAGYAREKSIVRPHAVCIPLWPGDSHFASIYEYGVINTRVRLLNGYSPSVPAGYYENVFSKLDSLNCGVFTEEQRVLLSSIGVNMIIFHEQPYPSKVSPFTSAIALERMRSNPALEEIAHAGGAVLFAFTGAAAADRPLENSALHFPAATHWPASRLKSVTDDDGRERFRPLSRAPLAFYRDNLVYRMLVSGGGRLVGEFGTEVDVPEDPAWVTIPFRKPFGEKFSAISDTPRILHALISDGEQEDLPVGASHTWQAREFFHMGYSEDDGSVSFAPTRNIADIVLYGPDIPFPPSEYAVKVDADAAPGDSVEVGDFDDAFAVKARVPMNSMESSGEVRFRHDGLLPIRIAYRYAAAGPVIVRSITLRRIAE